MTSVTSAEQLGRVRQLLRVQAKVRGVSYEPALGPVDFRPYLPKRWCDNCYPGRGHDAAEHRKICRCGCHIGISWLIVGGESGPGARPFDLAWARSAVQQCQDAGVAVFVKQMGSNARCDVPGGHAEIHFRARKGGDWSEWPQDLRIREFPQ